jgi:hypothetical protein
MACKEDPALVAVTQLTNALRDAFTGTECPPLVGNVGTVRFFAGDGAPLAAWDSHASQGCDTPFVWVRLVRRYLSHEFPAPAVSINPCLNSAIRVVAVEAGVGWCAVVDAEPTWAEYATEAAASMDASWRIEIALKRAACALKADDDGILVGRDTLAPYGPEGGVIAWTGVLYVSY